MSQRRQSKSIPVIYGGLAGMLLILIAATALVLVPPSPPQVAEFAPQAQENIDEAPDSQSSQFGSGNVSCAVGQVCEETGARESVPPRTVVERARVRRCVGDPPRQTEDPQSPPCANYFHGENGGATTRGVTRDEIRLAISDAQYTEFYAPFAEFFNSRFEFYGRKIRLVGPLPDPRGGAESQRASAAGAKEHEAFAAIPWIGCSRCLAFLREASRLGIVTVSFEQEASSEEYRSMGNSWSFIPPIDEVGAHLSEFACKSLVGRSAAFAGGAERVATRRFAILQYKDRFGSPHADASPLARAIERCGGEVSVHEYDTGSQIPGNDSTPNRLLMLDLQRRGVTTIILFGDVSDAVILDLMPTASNSGYQPEWITHATANEAAWRIAPADQTQHLIGLLTRNKLLPVSDQPYGWADREVGSKPSEIEFELEAYYEMLVLASGIQAAGPRLTPGTFAKGLQGLRFPNPGAAGPPYYQATVGFAGDHAMVEDAGLTWWSSSAPSYTGNPAAVGGWCYLGRGARWSHNKWPTGQPNLFDPDPRNCR